ncbi:two-component sensor histidine kinase [Thermobispora bispora]|nr:HAMP domain-containing sensor histidine kinase [Thermobispora bispora]QSI48389.1 HAMP domain-containing histidine kinase [Thermobispora bispora]
MPLPWRCGWSFRARLTLIGTLVAALVLIPAVIAAHIIVRYSIVRDIEADSIATATRVAAEVRSGGLPSSLRPDRNGIDLIEVVDAQGRTIAATPAAGRLSVLTPLRPTPENTTVSTTTCALPERRCVHLAAVRVTPGDGSPVVYAGRSSPSLLGSLPPAPLLLLLSVALCGLIALAAWRSAGRLLRPVAAIRSELAEVGRAGAACRLREPPGDDEIARLARTANDALARLEKSIQQQRRFAADASHELRTPIAGIRAQLECARLHPEDTAEAVEAALRDTDRLESLVSDLLLLTRIGTTPKDAWEPIDLGQLARAELARRSGKARVEDDLAPGVVVSGLPSQLTRMLANLLDNAERHAASVVRVRVARSGDEAVLSVYNDGKPIPEADRERLFEPFYRTDPARSRTNGGTGLGLAIAREVVQAHGGTIRVEDTGGAGALFVARLPLAEHRDEPGATAPRDEPGVTAPAAAGTGIRPLAIRRRGHR